MNSFRSIVSWCILAACLVGLPAGESQNPTAEDMRIVQQFGDVPGPTTDANRAPGVDYGMSVRPSEASLDLGRGELNIVEDDIVYQGLIPWGHRRTYSNRRVFALGNVQGYRWVVTQMPFMRVLDNATKFIVYTASGSGIQFKITNGVIVPQFANRESLRYNSTEMRYYFTDTNGYVLVFDNDTFTNKKRFKEYRDPSGNALRTEYDANGNLTRVFQSRGNGTSAANADMEMIYTYIPNTDLPNTYLINSVTLRVKNSANVLTDIRTAVYGYIVQSWSIPGVTPLAGQSTNLQSVTIRQGNSTGSIISQTYYRYWHAQSGGYTTPSGSPLWMNGMIQHVVGPQTVARLGVPTRWSDWTDANLDLNADRVVGYNWFLNDGFDNRVRTMVVRGDPRVDEIGTWTMAYVYNQNSYWGAPGPTFTDNLPDDPCYWWVRAKAVRKDAAGVVMNNRWVYANPTDAVLLDATEEVVSPFRKWANAYTVDKYGRVLTRVFPDGITGWDDATFFDLVGNTRINRDVASNGIFIRSATNANPCRIGFDTKPFVTGDTIQIDFVTGMPELNNGTYVVTSAVGNTYDLVGVDSRTFGVFTSFQNPGKALLIKPANAQFLKDTVGKIETTSYYTSPSTATSSVAGGVEGLVEHTRLQSGESASGGRFLQSTQAYIFSPSLTTGEKIAVPSVSTVYPGETTTPTGGQSTTMTYVWAPSTLRYTQRTTSAPAVPVAKNGSGSSVQSVEVFDNWGKPIWTKDGDGYLRYTLYAYITGGVTKAIADVDTSKTADFLSLPSGWSTPAGGGRHLITQTVYDGLGRPTKFTDATGVNSFYFYNDVAKEYRMYPAWNAMTAVAPLIATPVSARPPIQIRREYWATNWREALAVQVTGATTDPPPGNETIVASNIVSLTRQQLDVNYRVVTNRAYRSLPSGPLPTVFAWGSAAEYEETVTLFDNRGRPGRVTDPAGTRSWTTYDVLSRPIATSTGTNDVTQYPVTTTVYDGGNVGNGNVTRTTATDGTQTLTTNHTYDWRDRRIQSIGPDFITKKVDRDNLGRIITEYTYRSNASETIIEATATSLLLGGQREVLFDEMGRTYQAKTYPVAIGGALGAPTILRYWYDNRGNIVKIAEPNGLLRKASYDGLGIRWRTAVSTDAAETAWAQAFTLGSDRVIEQTDLWFNLAGDQVAQVEYKRKDTDATSTGPLTSLIAYATAQVGWFDMAHRQVGSATYGRDNDATTRYVLNTDGTIKVHATLKIPSEAAGSPKAPNASDWWQATATTYDGAGRQVSTTDNAGRVVSVSYDLMGRKLKEIQNHVNGTP